jgi:hypothetical protein
MSEALLTAATTMMCPHGGAVMPSPGSTRASAGAPILRSDDSCSIVGCAFNVASVPSPCLTVQWVTAAARVTHGGTAVLTQASVGLCLAATQAPQGPVQIVVTQPRVTGQ